ncbi:hypothetical protein TRE132_23060 [Pseudomonas chlororaphis subsp. aurantiaca]|nr:hypothetical protein TRE132_23060 [Pseudomonas chlororaphis subsp. aurantiaca]
MSDKRRVLFVCARNDARSLMAEALLRHADAEDFDAFSAGLEASEIDPRTLESLEHIGIDTEGLRSKALDEFAGSSSTMSSPCATSPRKRPRACRPPAR